MITPLKDINKDIIFEPISHTYTHTNGDIYSSVSSVIDLFKPTFDPEGHIKRAVAKKEGCSADEIQQRWSKIAEDACLRGTDMHSQLEHFINTGETLDSTYKDAVEQFSKLKFKGKLNSEIRLHTKTHKISGTADLLDLYDENCIHLLDFKSNKAMSAKSKYGTKLLYPLEKYDDCSLDKYTIQFNLYKYMLEEHGYNVKKMTLLWFNPETRIFDSFKIKDIQKDILKMLEHYKSIMNI